MVYHCGRFSINERLEVFKERKNILIKILFVWGFMIMFCRRWLWVGIQVHICYSFIRSRLRMIELGSSYFIVMGGGKFLLFFLGIQGSNNTLSYVLY